MSWSGFKKNVGRATTQVMMKTGHVEKTADRGYEVEERRYRTLESASLRLQKEAKGYLDSLRAMTASQMRIAETIDAFYGDSGVSDGVSRSYKGAVEDLDAETVKALDGPYRSVEPDRPLTLEEGRERKAFRKRLLKDKSLEPYLVDQNGMLDEGLVKEIEDEYFCGRPCRQEMTAILDDFKGSLELIDHLYRTTVLEPINRFCAYFPDINECIKKRNNKMLDYDSMRSKVRRLTEKPDKDASKLPRTEKEAEMVSHDSTSNFSVKQRYLSAHQHPAFLSSPKKASPSKDKVNSGQPFNTELDLAVPSPPKALQRPEIMKLKQDDQLHRSGSTKRTDSWNLMAALAGVPVPGVPVTLEAPSRRATSSSTSTLEHPSRRTTFNPEREDSSMSMPAIFDPRSSCSLSAAASASTETLLAPAHPGTPWTPRSLTTPSLAPSSPTALHTPMGTIPSARMHSSARISSSPSPFPNPSDLEEIMVPLKREFAQRQSNLLSQAKAAYEQLNEQLSNELPQLIDLRVPYLDPSFEALVKIQLRFCAEAYSRMAQVQQYLDPTTRDQYANGELDSRVEDVLGQIRELSIAGTV